MTHHDWLLLTLCGILCGLLMAYAKQLQSTAYWIGRRDGYKAAEDLAYMRLTQEEFNRAFQ